MRRRADAMRPNVTIADVARAAGCATSTVSRALSQPGRVSDAVRRRVETLAAELGYEVSGEFHDNGRTRPALDQALATIRDGQASALIVADLYRLSRPSTEFARIIEALDEADVPLYVVGQGRVSLPATPELGIMLAIAEYEAKHSEEDFTL